MLGNYETFRYRDERWTRFPAPAADEAFIMGVDLGQSADPSAVVVMHHHHEPLNPDDNDSWVVDKIKRVTKQKSKTRYDIVHAERLPLGTSYPDVVAHVRNVLSRPPLRDRCHLVLDESGVGRPVADAFEQAGMNAVRVSITAGTDAVKQEHRRWSVAKSLLISGVDARLHSGELRFATGLTEAHALVEELKDFRRHLTSAGRATYQARTGKHDDLVLAVAIALWWAVERRRHQIYIGPLLGLC